MPFLSFADRVARALRRRGRLASASLGWHARPDFLLIGAQKAGTTALHQYLSSHPELVAPAEKELHFFSPESFADWTEFHDYARYAGLAEAHAQAKLPPSALRWYHTQFPLPTPGRRRLFFESTPCYLYFPQVAERILHYRPDMKLLVLLRDPVERAYSAWNMLRQFDTHPWSLIRDERSFEQAIEDELCLLHEDPTTVKTDYLRRSLYAEQLTRYFSLFPREQIKIIGQHELKVDTNRVLNSICEFVGVSPFRVEREWKPVFVGQFEGGMAPQTRDFLVEFFAPHNEKVFNLIGRELPWAMPKSSPSI